MDEEQQTAEGPQPTGEEPKSLGLERWVQFGFVLVAIVTFFLADKLIEFVWGYFAQPEGAVVTGAAAIVGILAGYLMYRHPKLNPLAHEVAGELAKVTWPSRQETWYSTVVVIVTSIIAAVYLGAFDALWSAFTDLIYSTS
jgi:preprotein translocase subunit SecE